MALLSAPVPPRETPRPCHEPLPGIVISQACDGDTPPEAPRISAFVWGGRVEPEPTLPYGRATRRG